MSNWTLLSNHGHVLVCLSRDSEARLRDVAADVGITERAVQKIVRDLQDGGMISVTKSGRRNTYKIHKKQTLRHDLEAECTLKDLIKIINRQLEAKAAGAIPSAKPKVEERIDAATAPGDPDNRRKAEPAPPSNMPKAAKPVAAKDTGKKESKPTDSLEKQQGTLF